MNASKPPSLISKDCFYALASFIWSYNSPYYFCSYRRIENSKFSPARYPDQSTSSNSTGWISS